MPAALLIGAAQACSILLGRSEYYCGGHAQDVIQSGVCGACGLRLRGYSWADMSIVDIIILGIVAFSTAVGFYWGLIRMVIAVIGLGGGIFVAGRYYANVAAFLHPVEGGGLVGDENWARIIAFVGIVIGVSLLLGLLGSILRMVAKLLFIGCLDRALGGLLGFLMSIIVVLAVVVVVTVFPVPVVSDAVQTSAVAQQLSGFVPVVLAFLPPEFQQYFELAKLVVPGLP